MKEPEQNDATEELARQQLAARITEREHYLISQRQVTPEAIRSALEDVDGGKMIAVDDVLRAAAAAQALAEHDAG